MRKWNVNDIVKFLSIYEYFPLLWNMKVNEDNIASKKLREKRFEKLLEVMDTESLLEGMTKQQLRAKIKGIKDVYRQELAKIERSKKAAGGEDDIYKPKLAWFDDAHFLRDVISTRESKSNNELSFVREGAECDVEIKEVFFNTQTEAVEEIPNETPHKRKVTDPPSDSPGIQTQKKIKNEVTSSIDDGLPYVSEVHSKITSPTEDVFYQFGKYVAAELRDLPTREAILLQQEMQNSITRVKLYCYQP